MRKVVSSLLFVILIWSVSDAQEINPSLLKNQWSAYWIAVPSTPAKGYGVYYFRKNMVLDERPSSFIVHASGDNRYKLFVNGQLISMGPARSDLNYWNYETVDIASLLKKGKNTVAAIVWNEGDSRPEGQISNQTAFLLQGNNAAEEIVNTNSSWKCFTVSGYKPIHGIGYSAYYVAGPGEFIDMNAVPQGWMENDFDDNNWISASIVGWRTASPKGILDIASWMLVPASIPQMELKKQGFASVRNVEGLEMPGMFSGNTTTISIPSNCTKIFLLDQSELTNAYPVISFSKGKYASITLTYAEALFNELPNGPGKTFKKGNRNEVEGKQVAGRKDSIISNGSENQEFTSLSWRTFRYIEVKVITKDEPLVINELYSVFTGYPFSMKAAFNAKDDTLRKIFDIGWHTARLCAVETYMDCPYYEQLQYIGDTRIQALVSLYNSGDDRLVRNAIEQMDRSRMAEGITLSRHPSFSPQQIPTFSLWYIGMLNDYWMYRGDSVFVKDKMQGVRDVLWFFNKYQQKDGSLRNVPYWVFTDWVEGKKGWPGGVGPIGKDGSSSLLDLQLLLALQTAVKMENELGFPAMAEYYRQKADQLQRTIQLAYWDDQKQLYADSKDMNRFSQHANALAILTNTIQGQDATKLAKKIMSDMSLMQASIYFKYYLHIAYVKAGLGNDYLKWLDIWKQNIQMGMTTWAEISEIDNARSDCHAWGASPNIEFFRTVLGIDTDAPGFSKVKVEPHLGDLKDVNGSIPHPSGTISASYKFVNGKWIIEIGLPDKISGRFIWKGKAYPLKLGKNNFQL